MSYSQPIQPLSAVIREKLRQPAWIATFASVAVHGVILAILPILPSSSVTEDPAENPVGLIELTPEEQARIPDFSTPDIALPPLTPDSDLYSLSPLPNQSAPTQLPPNLPPFYIPPYSFELPPAPQIPQIPRIPQTQSQPRPQISQPRSLPSLSPSPPQAQVPDEETELSPDSATTRQVPDLQALARGGATPTEQPSPEPQERRTPEQAPQDLIARQQELRNFYAQLRSPDSTGTQPQEVTAALQNWVETLGITEQNRESPWQRVDLKVSFPQATCFLRRDVGAIFGVVVDPDGKVKEEPEPKLIQSSGYDVLNQRALEEIKTRTFDNETDQDQPLLVPVEFDYNADACPASVSPPAQPQPNS